jgi:hypothetical protein
MVVMAGLWLPASGRIVWGECTPKMGRAVAAPPHRLVGTGVVAVYPEST